MRGHETTNPPAITGPIPDDLRDTRGIVVSDRLRLLPGSNWGMTDLQSVAFPLGEGAFFSMHAGFPATSATEERARVAAEFRANIETLLVHHP